MAKREIGTVLSVSRKFGMAKRSGAIYSSESELFFRLRYTSDISWLSCELFMNAADMPFSLAASTWSFIREISGLMTTVVPSIIFAGS